MSIAQLCIKRPVSTIVFTLFLIILGIFHYQELSIRQLPNIDAPKVTVTTDFPGANPELVETAITTPIENSLAGIANVQQIRSNSSLGQSRVSLRFPIDTAISDQLAIIRNKMASIKNQLPDSASSPIIKQRDDNKTPLLIIGFSQKNTPTTTITNYLSQHVKSHVEQLPGVAEAYLYGKREFAIKLWLSPEKMAARHITVNDIKRRLQEQNISIPSGQIKSQNRNYSVIVEAKFDEAKDLEALVVKHNDKHITRLKDIATLEISAKNNESYFRVNGLNAVGLAVFPQANANPIKVAKSVTAYIAQLKAVLPAAMHANTVYNSATFIEFAVNDVYITLLETVVLVVIVVFLFLGNLRATLIPIVTIPICLLATFWPMHLLGFSINTLTLLALVLAIGLVVDDAIVILEAIYSYRQAGLSKVNAAIKGCKEMSFAVIAMTMTLAVVYAPLAFIKGFSGKLFIQFGLTLAIAVIFSGLIALTLSPMMCAQLLNVAKSPYNRWLDRQFERLSQQYQRSIAAIFNRRIYVGLGLLCLIVLGVYSYQRLPAELAPQEDQGYILGLLSPPTDASIHYTLGYTKALEQLYNNINEKENYLSFTQADNVFSVINLTPWNRRTRSQKAITAKLNKHMRSLIGVNAFAVSPAPLGRRHANNSALTLRLMSHLPYAEFNQHLNQLVSSLKTLPGLAHVSHHLKINSDQVAIKINRRKLTDQNIKLADVADTLKTMLGGTIATQFDYQGQRYDILLQLQKTARADLDVLTHLYVQSDQLTNVPLSSITSSENRIGLSQIQHVDRMRSADITAELNKGYKMGDAIKVVQEHLSTELPTQLSYQFAGSASDFLASKGSTLTAFLLALLFIYLILAAQFESFILPVVILVTVPLSIIGALIGLSLCGGSLNIYSNIGMVTLIGLISKHGILITELSRQNQAQGMALKAAVRLAATRRLRPILMTTAAMVLGALPLALAHGAGAEARQQLGYTIIFGMGLGTLFSLYIVPMVYMLVMEKVNVAASEHSQNSPKLTK